MRQEHSSFAWGTTWIVISATMLSFSFLFLKITLLYFDYFFLIFLRFIIPFLLVVGVLFLTRKWKETFKTTHFTLQLLRSGCVLIAQYAFAFYISYNTLLNATVLLNAAPLFIPLIEWIFLKNRPGKSTIFGALVSFLGVILVLQPDTTLFTAMSGIGLLAALGQAGSQVLYGLRAKTESILSNLFYLFGLTGVSSFVIFLFTKQKNEILIDLNFSAPLLGLYLLLMAITTFLNQYYRGRAYHYGSPSTLAPFLYFSVFVSALLDWLIYKNIPTLLSIIGTLLIILGGILKVFLRAHILNKRKK